MRRLTLSLCGLALVVPLLATTACAPAEQAVAPGEPVHLRFATLPVTDMLPLYYAMDNGWFEHNNLTVDDESFVTANGGSDAVTKMAAGEVDIAFSSYTPFLTAMQKQVADLRLIADATAAARGGYPILTVERSPVRVLRDVAGHRVAITNLYTMSHYKTMSVLRDAGVDLSTVEFVEVPFPAMGTALRDGLVDAAYVAEPFATQYQQQVGAFAAGDSATGPTANIPLTGYGTTKKWAEAHPEALASFQKVMVCATEKLKLDRDALNGVAVRHIKNLSEDIANVMVANDYRSSLDPLRLDRVRNLMNAFPNPQAQDPRPLPQLAPMIIKPPTLVDAESACR